MQRLSGLDATFLYMETQNAPMHVAGILIIDPSTCEGGFSYERIRQTYASRLHCAPPFRRRLVEVPLGLHHPIWIEDPNFDLDWHLRQVTVPAPGGRRELNELIAKLVAIPLDRTRPLWESWVIEGLEDGNVAVLSKVHHSAIDGMAGNQMMVALLDLEPGGTESPEPEEPWQPDHVPSDTEMFGYAVASLAQTPVRAFKTLRRTAEVALRIREQNRKPDVDPPPSPFSAPNTSFNRTLTPRRSFSTITLPLSDIKEVKSAFGVTVNDVVLELCGGALRSYLDARGESPDGPLVAMVPVSVRTEAQSGDQGNQVSTMLASLATDLDDPAERLARISKLMRDAKEQQQLIGADTLQNWAEFAAPAIAARAVRTYSRMKMADLHRPLFNVTISNVPGPPFPLYFAGCKLVASYPTAPVFDGGGLNMTVMSYMDNMDFGITACPDVIDDVDEITSGLNDELERLKKAIP